MDRVYWFTNGWIVECGVVERVFTLAPQEFGRVQPRYRAQVQGFVGGIDELYLALTNVSRAIEGEFGKMLGEVVSKGRSVFTVSTLFEGTPGQLVVTVERDPRDLIGDRIPAVELEGTPQLYSERPEPPLGGLRPQDFQPQVLVKGDPTPNAEVDLSPGRDDAGGLCPTEMEDD